jgi:putative transposase
MRKSRYSEEQIIGMLRVHEAGVTTKELCRKCGILDATFYICTAKLKWLLAGQVLDNTALKSLGS